MMKFFNLIFIVFFSSLLFSQARKPKHHVKDTLSPQAFIIMVERNLDDFYAEFSEKPEMQKVLDDLNNEQIIPELSDDEICKQIEKLNKLSVYKLDCNEVNLTTIKFFQKNRRSFVRICLSRSKLYFDLYEEFLNKYDLPKELRFLSVIESGLRPQVKSPAGALGLWQFMYGTGKMYGLAENSYLDERMDPVKSTDAACRYLKKLFDIYGDWNLALAAYNAGPGNINKAIRRSGGKNNYWDVRPFLPRETQGYVPNFVAAVYLMSFHRENLLFPVEIPYYQHQMDTVCLNKSVHFESISALLNIDVDEIKKLNPIYKKNIIPETNPKQCITLNRNKIGTFIDFEDSLYKYEQKIFNNIKTISLPEIKEKDSINNDESNNLGQSVIYHKVKKGETITKIAQKYSVSTADIKIWNKLKSNKLSYGRNLKIITESKPISKTENKTIHSPTYSDSIEKTITYDTIVNIYHIVQRNETLENIAKLYNISTNELMTVNNLTTPILNLGQKLQVFTKIQLSKIVYTPKEKNVELKDEKLNNKTHTKPKYYIVKSGDLFNRIAQKHQLSLNELRKLNPNVNPDRIREGQKLRVK